MREGKYADRHGARHGDLSGEPQRGVRDRAHPARRHRDGRLQQRRISAPATATVMTQVAADALGFAPENVRGFALGATRRCRKRPVSGGSQSVASVSPAVRAAAMEAREQLVALANADPSSPVSVLRHATT